MICFSEKELLNFFRYNDYLKGTYLSGITNKLIYQEANIRAWGTLPLFKPAFGKLSDALTLRTTSCGKPP